MRPANEQWEYLIAYINSDHLQAALGVHGRGGWEAWSISPASDTSDRVIFKRRRA